MTFRLQITRLLLAALCVCLVFSAIPLAHSQDAPAQQGQSAQSEQPQPNTHKEPAKEGQRFMITRETAYRRFIENVGGVDAGIQESKEKGKKPSPITFREDLGIGEDDFNALYIVVVDAYRRIKANYDEFASATRALDNSSAIARQESDQKAQALAQACGQNVDTIVDEAIARSKQVLTEEGFKKADAYICSRYGGGKTEFVPLHRPSSAHQDPGIAPAPEQPQGVQP